MESPILKQIVNFLQTRKKQKQWMVVFVFMAVVVGFGTVTALKMMGQAMTRKEHVLDCQLKLHEHTKSCYDSNKNLICGYADYAVHKHNDDCYNSEGKLMCRLPEVEKHEHTKKCYEKIETLVCGQEESAGHEHTDGCYTTQKGDLKCKTEEHSHSDGCYDEEGNLTCGKEEHQHNDDCYKYEDVLTCKIKEGEGGHKHTDKCYDVQEVLTCGKLEMHKHTDKCFEKIDKNGKDEPENLKLVCKKTELLEHTHTEDAGCLRTVDAAEADVIQAELDKEAEEAALDKAAEEGREIFTTDMNEEEENGEDAGTAEGEEGEAAEGEDAANPEGETAEGEDGAAADEAEPETYEETKTYEGLGYIVTASYNKDANIPEEAKFVAERITKESDEEDYKKHEEEYKKSVGNENATMSALFKIGFYVDGEEVEPATPVAITVQFVDKNGLPEGAPIKVVHFGDDKTEVIDGSKAESGSTSFKTDGFSKFGLGPEEVVEDTKESDSELVPISGDYTYEGDVFDIAFHIEGNATFSDDHASLGDKTISESTSEESENGEGDATEGTEAKESETSQEEDRADTDNSEGSVENTNDSEEGAADTETKDKDSDNENSGENKGIEFVAKDLGEESAEYQTFVAYMQDSGKNVDLMQIRTLSYDVIYDGRLLNIEDCDITADIIPKEAMINNTQEDGDGSAIEAFEIKSNSTVNEIETVPMNNEEERRVARLNNLSGEPLVASVRSNSNPEFTVQYYAYMHIMEDAPNLNTNAKASIDLIDTSGGNLPTNKVDQNKKYIYVDGTKEKGTWRDIVYKGRERSLEMIYSESPYNLLSYPGLENFDKFATKKNGEGLGEASKAQHHYDTTEVWVLKEGENPESKAYTDWTIYGKKNAEKGYIDVDVDVHSLEFTNNPDAETETKILVTDNTVIRLVADINSESYTNDVAFYDYDITDGKVYTDKTLKTEKDRSTTPLYANTNLQGINDPRNYNDATSSRLGFGNGNTGGTGLHADTTEDGWNINIANGANGVSKVYKNCSFGLVSKTLGANGYPAFNVNAPDLFSSETQVGKTAVLGRSLEFNRDGDTYTLSKVKNGNDVNAENLERLQYTGNAYTGKFDMWVNQFWPMDHSAETYNKDGHDLKFGNQTDHDNKQRMAVGKDKVEAFPASDDGQDHNSYFGMYFSVKFELTEDYVGPLNYYFFGDDDMWVYLDNKLICDIGGCHQAAGEYVNLWDWIKKGDAGTHTLRFFYTERGASGSTCWMQFTLPSVREIPVGKPTGKINDTLTITKNVEGVATTDKFEFKISLLNESGTPLSNTYPYQIIDSEGNVTNHQEGIAHNGTFRLGNGESIVVEDLPDNAKYKIEETNVNGYLSTVAGQVIANGTTGGIIDWYGKDDENVQYINVSTYELPETGGSGLMIYTIAGALCILLGAGFMYTKKARERRV